MKKCPHCNADMPEGATECPECKKPVEAMAAAPEATAQPPGENASQAPGAPSTPPAAEAAIEAVRSFMATVAESKPEVAASLAGILDELKRLEGLVATEAQQGLSEGAAASVRSALVTIERLVRARGKTDEILERVRGLLAPGAAPQDAGPVAPPVVADQVAEPAAPDMAAVMASCAEACLACADACAACVAAGCDEPSRKACQEACDACALACEACVKACVGQPGMEHCVEECAECVVKCKECSAACAAGSEDCAERCEKCAESCRECAEACGAQPAADEPTAEPEMAMALREVLFAGTDFDPMAGSFEDCVAAAMKAKGIPEKNARALCAYIKRQAGEIASPQPAEAQASREIDMAAALADARIVTAKREIPIQNLLSQAGQKLERYTIERDEKTGARYAKGLMRALVPGMRKDMLAFIKPEAVAASVERLNGIPMRLDHPKKGPDGKPELALRDKIGMTQRDARLGDDHASYVTGHIYDPDTVDRMANAKLGGDEDFYSCSFRGKVLAERVAAKIDGVEREFELVSDVPVIRSLDLVDEGALEGAGFVEQAASLAQAEDDDEPAAPAGVTTMYEKAKALKKALALARGLAMEASYDAAVIEQARIWIDEAAKATLATEQEFEAALGDDVISAKLAELATKLTPAPAPGTTRIEAGLEMRDHMASLLEGALVNHASNHDTIQRALNLTGKRVEVNGDVAMAHVRGVGHWLDVYNGLGKATVGKGRAQANGDAAERFTRYIPDTAERAKVATEIVTRDFQASLASFSGSRVFDMEAAVASADVANATADQLQKIMRTRSANILRNPSRQAPIDVAISSSTDSDNFIASHIVGGQAPAAIGTVAELVDIPTLASPATEVENLTPELYAGLEEWTEWAIKNDTAGVFGSRLEELQDQIDWQFYISVFSRWAANSNMTDGAAILTAAAGNRTELAYTFPRFLTTLELGDNMTQYGLPTGANAIPIRWKPTAACCSTAMATQLERDCRAVEAPDTASRASNPTQTTTTWRGMGIFAEPQWTNGGQTDRIVVFGDPNLGPIGHVVYYEGRRDAEAWVIDARNQGPGVSKNSVYLKVRRGWVYRPVSRRNVVGIWA